MIVLCFFLLEFDEKLRVDDLSSSALQDVINLVYENTSKHLLDVLFTKYKFMDHLKVSIVSVAKYSKNKNGLSRLLLFFLYSVEI